MGVSLFWQPAIDRCYLILCFKVVWQNKILSLCTLCFTKMKNDHSYAGHSLLIYNCVMSVVSTVDTSEAGFGDLDVSVTQCGVGVPVKRNQVSCDLARYCFTVKVPKQHLIHVSFNGENVPGQCLSF